MSKGDQMTEHPASQHVRLALLGAERWWGGAVADGQLMSFGRTRHSRDLADSAGVSGDARAGNNQSAPLLLSDRGRFVWSEQPFAYTISDDAVDIVGCQLIHGRSGDRLRDAYRTASATFFPASGRTPPLPMLNSPQYNTWIEMPFRPSQAKVLAYAEQLLNNGFPPGVLMIDDRWSVDYGTWSFDKSAFPDPTAMVERLHTLGFSVMLWLVPFVDQASRAFATLAAQDLLVLEPDGRPAIREWWNGHSGVLDATNPAAVAWLCATLDTLIADHGVDGFTFDGGDMYSYSRTDCVTGDSSPAGQCEAWARLGLRYKFNEFRACWKMGGTPLVQRLHDKPPTWGAGGLASLIPEAIAQGLIGHAFSCPDMIGGGDVEGIRRFGIDQELFVRYAQCAALFPMMQFSLSPSRVLDDSHLSAVRSAVDLHQLLVSDILKVAKESGRTGEPIVRPLAYHYADYGDVVDQFLLGENILAAPVLEPQAVSRRVQIPPGTWTDADGIRHEGPTIIDLPVTITSIPVYRRDTSLDRTGLPGRRSTRHRGTGQRLP